MWVENTSVEMERVPASERNFPEILRDHHTPPEPRQGGGRNRGAETITSTARTTAKIELPGEWGKECCESFLCVYRMTQTTELPV